MKTLKLSWNLEQEAVRMKSLNNWWRSEINGTKLSNVVCYVDFQNFVMHTISYKKAITTQLHSFVQNDFPKCSLSSCPCVHRFWYIQSSAVISAAFIMLLYERWVENEMHWWKINFPCRIWNGMTALLLKENKWQMEPGVCFSLIVLSCFLYKFYTVRVYIPKKMHRVLLNPCFRIVPVGGGMESPPSSQHRTMHNIMSR